MESISVSLILLFAVVVERNTHKALADTGAATSSSRSRSASSIAAVADLGVTLDPDLFFLLFLPPLLFLDGWRIPKEGLLPRQGRHPRARARSCHLHRARRRPADPPG
jgi:NhaP-type Na+/H+ or K+/H+ antiporter